MSLLDDYNQNTGDESAPADIRKKRAELERQIVILESDLKKARRRIFAKNGLNWSAKL